MPEHRLQDVIDQIPYSNGEAIPGPEDTTLSAFFRSHLTYKPWQAGTACHAGTGKHHLCGGLIAVIYWTLAKNKLRVGYGGRAAGCDILYDPNGNYFSDPARLANVAFTFAIASVPEETNVNDFFYRVSERYHAALNDGWINAEERHRIEQTMAVHCVGWSGPKCASANYHKTAWQDRPAIDTWKASFQGQWSGCGFTAASQTHHFVRGDNMTLTGNQTTSRVTLGTSGDGFKYVYLNELNQTLCKTLTFPTSGNYKIHGAVRPQNSSTDNFQAGINGTFANWDIEDYFGGWIWSHTGPTFNVTAGDRSVCLKRTTENIDVDAIWVEKVP